MKIRRVFQTVDAKSLNQIFSDIVKSEIDTILKGVYDSVKVNTATSHSEGKEI